jgi:hypothetical protein
MCALLLIVSGRAKLIEKIRNNPKNVRFEELCKATEMYGFVYMRHKGSHVMYAKGNIFLNYQNINGMAKAYQIRQFLDAIDMQEETK